METFEFHVLKFQDIFLSVIFFKHGSSDSEGLSQPHLELVDGYQKRFMPQNGQVAVLKCSPVWTKICKSFKTLSERNLKFIPKAYKREAICSLKIEIVIRLLFFFNQT